MVPFYNVLGARTENSSLIIDYSSDPSKSPVKAHRDTFQNPQQHEVYGNRDLANVNVITIERFAELVLQKAYDKVTPKKKAYILVNPSSGPGGAVKRWEKEAKPLFDAAGLESDVVILSRGGEAEELVQTMDIDKYDTVVSCSGDGTPYEIFNGLAKRPDAAKALSKVAVSHLPCGSGNGLALNLYGSNKAGTAAMGIIKGVITPLDLASVTQGSTRMISFLSQAFGMIADSDLNTEHLRWMGSTRFEVGLTKCVFQKKCYPCDLAVKVELDDKTLIKAHYKKHMTELERKLSGESSEPLAAGEPVEEGLPKLQYGTVQDDLPEGWSLIPHEKIGNFYCGNVSIEFQPRRASFTNITCRWHTCLITPTSSLLQCPQMACGI